MSLIAVAATIALGHAQIDPNVVIWRTYKAGTRSKAQDQQILVLDTLGDYQRYINKYGPDGAGDGHDVDWNKEELVAIHIGTRNTGGYSVEVSTISKAVPNQAKVSWAELTPVKGLAVTQNVTSPWTIVRLNRPGARLVFEGRKEEGRLPGGIKIITFPGFGGACSCCNACVREHQNRLPWQVYASGDDSPAIVPSTTVVNSAIDFDLYARGHGMTGLGDGSNVDWRNERLVAIHLGRKISVGYQLLIDHVDAVDNRRVDVSYVQVQPTGRPFLLNGNSGNYLIIRIPKVGSLVTCSQRVVRDTDPLRLDSCSCGCDSCRHCGR